MKLYILCFKIFAEQVTRHSWQRFCKKWKYILLNKLRGFLGFLYIENTDKKWLPGF